MDYPIGQPLTAYLPPGERLPQAPSVRRMLPGAQRDLAIGESDTPFYAFDLDLSVDRTLNPYPLVYDGDYVEFNNSTNATDVLKIAYNSQLVNPKAGAFRYFFRGSTFSGPRFKTLFIYHSSIPASVATILVARQFVPPASLTGQS